MKKTSQALTLVELIVSTVIVSMVVAGVFSAQYALRRMSEAGGRDVASNIQVKAVAESVRMAARSLHGDPGNKGFYFSAATKTFCLRHDTGSPATPWDYTNDNWTCYTQIGAKVYTCEFPSTTVCPASGVCIDPIPAVVDMVCPATTFVGQLATDQFTNAVIPAPEVMANAAAGVYYFEMTFVGRQDPTAATVSLTSKGTDDNPQTVVKIRENAAGF